MLNTKLNRTILFALIAFVGFWILIKSPIWGIKAADSYLRNQAGGTMNTTQYEALSQSFQVTYRWLGAIVFSIWDVFLLKNLSLHYKN